MRQVAAIFLTLLSAFGMTFAQAPTAPTEAMPHLRGAERIALRNVRIVDGTGTAAKQNQTMLIDSGRIRALGNAVDVSIPQGTRTLDLAGRTVLPGFVMLHEHMQYPVGAGVTFP